MRLYNLSGADHALINIVLRRIKISRIEDLNDPFELLGVNLKDKRLRQPFKDAKHEIHNNNGVICFSETWQNPVMWSHYADKHKGICLGFDVPDQLAMPVSYSETPLRIENASQLTKKQLQAEFAARLLTLKFKDWCYERERRIFIKLDHSTAESGLYFLDYSDGLMLREIILGARCDVLVSKARALAEAFRHKVHVKKTRIAFTKFAVVEDRRYREKEV